MDQKCLIPGNPTLIKNILNCLKAKGIFDELRHECLADVDTKSSYQNLSQRVDGYAGKYLANVPWNPDSNKNELRNNLRRHVEESGILSIGADIVIDQVFKSKNLLSPLILPKILEMSHQYIKEQTEPEIIVPSECPSIPEKLISNTLETKEKAQISDPIADILSFNNSKSKTSSVISTHVKTESIQHKHGDIVKVEKKKEEKNMSVIEKSALEGQGEVTITCVNEAKVQVDKEKDKIKKEDPEIHQEAFKKTVKDEVKFDKKQIDDIKVAVGEIATVSEESQSSASFKSNVSSKKDEKNKSSKSKSQGKQKSSISSSETKKLKRELSDSSEKLNKSKLAKSSKESLSPTKVSSSLKSVFKEEKVDSSKSKSHDPSCSKTSELSVKKSKSSYDKKDNASSKHKEQGEKIDKAKFSKSVDKNEPHIYHESSNNEKNSKNIQNSSSYDSSQGSDQEKNNFKGFEKERLKHFSKFVNTESSEIPDSSSETDRKQSSGSDENSLKKYKHEKDLKLKLKDTSAVEAAKISSRSNSFGSASSVSSSSNTSKDNLTSNSDEVSENSVKDKKKKALKEKDSCQNFSDALPSPPPPPPPPPPPSSSLTLELTLAESVEDTQSSFSDTEASRSEDEKNAESLSDSELECEDLINHTLNENALDSSTVSINAFYDIFLYSSSSSEFEGFGYSPERKNNVVNVLKTVNESDVSVSSVHTSDLSSFDDELSCDEETDVLTGGFKKKLTLNEAQELIEKRAKLSETRKNLLGNLHLVENALENIRHSYHDESKPVVGENLLTEKCSQGSSSIISSDDESPPTEPRRLLRRERKLNPRYSSDEYTSIFNCKKETFITKQSSPSIKSKSPTFTSSPKIESKLKKTENNKSFTENNKLSKGSSEVRNENNEMKIAEIDEMDVSQKNKSKIKKESEVEDDHLSDNKISSSDEIDSILGKEKFFKQNNKHSLLSNDAKLKDHNKLKPYNNSKFKKNLHSPKRKLEAFESTPVKRPCSRSSVDSSSSEFAPNENIPSNNEKNDFHEEKKMKDCNLKVSNLNTGVKKDFFLRQRATNNGDIMGQKDAFSKNSHGKLISNNEKKTNESDANKELSSL